ncbi:MAG: hypothetical protein KatS3mg080_1200 [Anoxybacillus sp.]|nr:MAG: hypothetical protein KatS3mg080_1200 [Anoxybacillus sp.]
MPRKDGKRKHIHVLLSIGEGIEQIWEVIEHFVRTTKQSGVFEERRREQMKDWLHAMIKDYLHIRFFHHPTVQQQLPNY